MKYGILNNRLQRQFGDQAGICGPVFRRGPDLKRKFVVESVTLNQEIVFDVIEFFLSVTIFSFLLML